MVQMPDITPLFWFAAAAIVMAIVAVICAPLVYFALITGTTAFLATVLFGVIAFVFAAIWFR